MYVKDLDVLSIDDTPSVLFSLGNKATNVKTPLTEFESD
jgi:hypothetical protein